MEDLKTIWNKMDALHLEMGQIINSNNVETIYKKLKREEELTKQYTPFFIPVVLSVMAMMVYVTEAYKGWIPMLGIALITIGAFVMLRLILLHRVPVEQYEKSQDATSFLQQVKEKLNKKVHLSALGVAIYTLCILGGLHLLIFGLESLVGKGGMVGAVYGTMLGLTGVGVGMMYKMHQMQYGEMLKMIDRFLDAGD
ncbi:MAG: hypothetical protein AAF960_14675 [Bacteroidota bacterium]